MINTLAVSNYRSLRNVVVSLGRLTLITGANGTGKSNLYRVLRLLSATARGTAVESIAREGGVGSVFWAGPERFSRAMRKGEQPIQGGPRQDRLSLQLGVECDSWCYAIDFGLATDAGGKTKFRRDPEIKSESIWTNGVWSSRSTIVRRRNSTIRVRDESWSYQTVEEPIRAYDSLLSHVAFPLAVPEIAAVRGGIRGWRFYDQLRVDADAPARRSQIGTRAPALSNDGHDLASAWQTILEIGDEGALQSAIADAFPGATVSVTERDGNFGLAMQQRGLLRALNQTELSEGTLRYLLWIAALLTPRPPSLMVLNEPETSLDISLLPSLARLMIECSQQTQLWVVTHSHALQNALLESNQCRHVELQKDLGETQILGQTELSQPKWKWPPR